MNELLEKYDAWLDDHGPAALVIREHLMPVEGHDGVLFPATFAASEDKTFKGGYNVDTFADGKNICLIDSVGSQANHIWRLGLSRHASQTAASGCFNDSRIRRAPTHKIGSICSCHRVRSRGLA